MNVYIDPMERIYYFVGSAECKGCKQLIESNLILHIKWRQKKQSSKETYCWGCAEKIQDNELVTENYTCIITEEISSDFVPIFFLPPSLINKNDFGVFNITEIMKGSEAEIIDRTRYAGRTDQHAALEEVKKNKLILEKRDLELGDSSFVIRDQDLEAEQEFRKKISKGDTRKALDEMDGYQRSRKQIKVDFESFFDQLKNSVPAIEYEEKKQLERD